MKKCFLKLFSKVLFLTFHFSLFYCKVSGMFGLLFWFFGLIQLHCGLNNSFEKAEPTKKVFTHTYTIIIQLLMATRIFTVWLNSRQFFREINDISQPDWLVTHKTQNLFWIKTERQSLHSFFPKNSLILFRVRGKTLWQIFGLPWALLMGKQKRLVQQRLQKTGVAFRNVGKSYVLRQLSHSGQALSTKFALKLLLRFGFLAE